MKVEKLTKEIAQLKDKQENADSLKKGIEREPAAEDSMSDVGSEVGETVISLRIQDYH